MNTSLADGTHFSIIIGRVCKLVRIKFKPKIIFSTRRSTVLVGVSINILAIQQENQYSIKKANVIKQQLTASEFGSAQGWLLINKGPTRLAIK